MQYFSISFTHKNTSIELRERLALNTDEAKKDLLRLVLANEFVDECVLLSTCNRLEIMCYTSSTNALSDYIIKCLCLICKVDSDLLKNFPDIYEDSGFIHHLFSVASSLDSLVIGETQITGQLKSALAFSQNYSDCENLAIAINYAFKCAAAIRNETQISKNSVSVSSLAVQSAASLCDLKTSKILIIGSAQMARLAGKHLKKYCDDFCIVSRTYEHAKALASELEVRAEPFEKLGDLLQKSELIFSATASKEPIITAKNVGKTRHKRYFFDIAVPRDIELENSELIEVFSVDDLGKIVQKNIEFKDEQAKIAYSLVAKFVASFYKELNQIQVSPIIKAMRLKAKACIEKELNLADKKGYLKDCDLARVKRFSEQLMNAYLHEYTQRLKNIDEFGYELEAIKFILGE